MEKTASQIQKERIKRKEDLLESICLHVPLPNEAVLWKKCDLIFHVIRRVGQRGHQTQQAILRHKIQDSFFDNGIGFLPQNQHTYIDGINHHRLFSLHMMEGAGVSVLCWTNVPLTILRGNNFVFAITRPTDQPLFNFHIHTATPISVPVLFAVPVFLILLGYLFSFFTFALAMPVSFNAISYSVRNSFSRKDRPMPSCFF